MSVDKIGQQKRSLSHNRFRLSVLGDEIANDLEAQIAAIHMQDIHFVEVRSVWKTNIVDLRNSDLKWLSKRLSAEGIGVSAIASPVGKAPIEGSFEDELHRFHRALAAAEELGTRFVRLFSFYIQDARYGEHRAEVLRRMSVFASEAESRNITLVHENDLHLYGDNPERSLDLVKSIASPALRLCFDHSNFYLIGYRPYSEAWPLLMEYVAHVHIKDAVAIDRTGLPPYPGREPEERVADSMRLPGEGQTELRQCLNAFIDIGYSGFLVLEPHLERRLEDLDGSTRVGFAVASLRRLLNEVNERSGKPE